MIFVKDIEKTEIVRWEENLKMPHALLTTFVEFKVKDPMLKALKLNGASIDCMGDIIRFLSEKIDSLSAPGQEPFDDLCIYAGYASEKVSLTFAGPASFADVNIGYYTENRLSIEEMVDFLEKVATVNSVMELKIEEEPDSVIYAPVTILNEEPDSVIYAPVTILNEGPVQQPEVVPATKVVGSAEDQKIAEAKIKPVVASKQPEAAKGIIQPEIPGNFDADTDPLAAIEDHLNSGRDRYPAKKGKKQESKAKGKDQRCGPNI